MKFIDTVFGSVLLALSIGIFVTARSFPDIPRQKIGLGAFPRVLAAILAVCSLMLIVRGVRSGQRWAEAGMWLRSAPHVTRFAEVVGALLFYLFASPALGFIVTGILLMLGLLLAFGVGWLMTISISVVSTLVIHSIFYKLLKVPLPWGLLQGVAW